MSKHMDRIELGKELKRLREKNGISTYKLKEGGFPFAQMKDIEDSRRAYTIDTLLKYCTAVGIDIQVVSKTISNDSDNK